MTPEQKKVIEFHQTFNLRVCTDGVSIPDRNEVQTSIALIDEELGEYIAACIAKDIVEVADALGDLLYVVYGAANRFGIDLEPVFNEIHKSNMTKVGGYKDANGKYIKPDTYTPANIAEVLTPISKQLSLF